jgi:transposase
MRKQTPTTASQSSRRAENLVAIGIDWADREHAFHLIDAQGNELAGDFEQTPEAIDDWVAMLRNKYPQAIFRVCVEQSKGALISALLMHADIHIFPINPTQLANYRKAMSHGGAKGDPTDARLLAQFLLHYGDQLSLLQPGDEATRKLTILAQDRRRIVDQRTAVANELKATLKQYFPLVLQLGQSRIYAPSICRLLLKWPTLEKLQAVKPTTLRKFFYGQNVRGDYIETKLELIAKAKPLTRDAAILQTYAMRVQRLAKLLLVDNEVIEVYDREIEKLLVAHADFQIVASLPGAALQMGSRIIAALGTDRARFTSGESLQTFTGIAPVTSQSGNTKIVSHRWACPKFHKQTFHEYAGLSIAKSKWARAYYDMMLSRGKKPQMARRSLAYKWQRIIFRCWQDRVPYDESRYIARLRETNSPLLSFLDDEGIVQPGV